MKKCFICHNLRMQKDTHGWFESESDKIELIPETLEYMNIFGEKVKLKIFECADCKKKYEELMNFKETEKPKKEEPKKDIYKPDDYVPDVHERQSNLDRE